MNFDRNAGVSTTLGVILLIVILMIAATSVAFFLFDIYNIEEEPSANIDITQGGSELQITVEQASQIDNIIVEDSSGTITTINNPQRGDTRNIAGFAGRGTVNIIGEYQGEERVLEQYKPVIPGSDYVDVVASRSQILGNVNDPVTFNVDLRNLGNNSVSTNLNLEITDTNGNSVYTNSKSIPTIGALSGKTTQIEWPNPPDDGIYTARLDTDAPSDAATVQVNVDTPPAFFLINLKDPWSQNWNYDTSQALSTYPTAGDNFSYFDQNDYKITSPFTVENVGEETTQKEIHKYILDESNRIDASSHPDLTRTTFNTTTTGVPETLNVVEVNTNDKQLDPGESYNSMDHKSDWTTPKFEKSYIETGTYTTYITTGNDTKSYEFEVREPPYYKITNMNYDKPFVQQNDNDVFDVGVDVKNTGGIVGVNGEVSMKVVDKDDPSQTYTDKKDMTIKPGETNSVVLSADVNVVDTYEVTIETPNEQKEFEVKAYPPTEFVIQNVTPPDGYKAVGEYVSYDVELKNVGGPGSEPVIFKADPVGNSTSIKIPNIWFIIDSSGSMRSAISQVKDGSQQFVDNVKTVDSDSEFGVVRATCGGGDCPENKSIAINETSRYISAGGIEQDLTSSKDSIKNAIASISGSTPEPAIGVTAALAKNNHVGSGENIGIILGNENSNTWYGNNPPDEHYEEISDKFDRIICICDAGQEHFANVDHYKDNYGDATLINIDTNNPEEEEITNALNNEVLYEVIGELAQSKAPTLGYQEEGTFNFDLNHTDNLAETSEEYNIDITTPDDGVEYLLEAKDPAYFDVTINNIPNEVEPDEEIQVDYTLENNGDVQGTQDVEIKVDGTTEESFTTTLNDDDSTGSSEDRTFTYQPSSTGETKTIEISTENATATDQSYVLLPAYFTASVSGPGQVTEGGTGTVTYSATNIRDATGTQTIQADGIGSISVTLDPGETWSRDYSRFFGSAGTYSYSMETENETASTSVTVVEPANFVVSIDSINDPVGPGDTLSVDYTVDNKGGTSDFQYITLSVNGYTTSDLEYLNPGSSSSGTLTYTIPDSASSGSLSLEVSSYDSTATDTADIQNGAFGNVEITSYPSQVNAGESIDITFEVTNTDSVGGNRNIIIAHGDEVSDLIRTPDYSKTITARIGPGQTKTFTDSFNALSDPKQNESHMYVTTNSAFDLREIETNP